jgi:hypothetical protein
MAVVDPSQLWKYFRVRPTPSPVATWPKLTVE